MDVLVWVTEWEMACCGTPIAIGDRVRWSVLHVPKPPPAWIESLLGSRLAGEVVFVETHHEPSDEDAIPLSGTVARIRSVICDRASSAHDPARFERMPATCEVHDLGSLDGQSGWSSPMTLLDGTPEPPPGPEDLIPVGPIQPGDSATVGWFVSIRRPRLPRRHRATEGYLVDLADALIGRAKEVGAERPAPTLDHGPDQV